MTPVRDKDPQLPSSSF